MAYTARGGEVACCSGGLPLAISNFTELAKLTAGRDLCAAERALTNRYGLLLDFEGAEEQNEARSLSPSVFMRLRQSAITIVL